MPERPLAYRGQLESSQTDLDGSLSKLKCPDSHLDNEMELLCFYNMERFGDPRIRCPFWTTSPMPDLYKLSDWLPKAWRNALLVRYKSFPDVNFDRKEFVLGSSVDGLAKIFKRLSRMDLRSTVFKPFACTSDPHLSVQRSWSVSDGTAEAIIKGPWAGDEVVITPLRNFLAQFKSGEVSPKEWRSADGKVMPILVELARQDGG